MQTSVNITHVQAVDPQALCLIPVDRLLYLGFKKGFDFVFALLLLILLSPFLLLVAVLIKLDSHGPVFFCQERVGVRLKIHSKAFYFQRATFCCYKFRTMVCNADPSLHKSYIKALIDNDCEGMAALQGGDTQLRKLVHDPRITRIGKFLRKYSIDEVPQFINVIKGEMSVVGPRPAIPYEVEMYKPWYFRRLETKPGITGLWQVSARSSVGFDDTVRLDIQYVDQQSIWLDLKIMLKTPLAVVSCKGAV